jgi:hypothetical protein
MVGTRGKGDITTGTNHLGFRCVLPLCRRLCAEGTFEPGFSLLSIRISSLFGAFAGSFPKINPSLLRVAINGVQLCIRELEVLDRIE